LNILTEQEINRAYKAWSDAATSVHETQKHLIVIEDYLEKVNLDLILVQYKSTKEEQLSLIDNTLNRLEVIKEKKRDFEFALAKAKIEVERIRSLLLFTQKGEIQ